MAKANRKQRRQPKVSSTLQRAVSSSSSESHEKTIELSTNSSPKWWDKLYEHWVEVVAGTMLGGLVVLFVSLWVTEYREHEGTKAQLARAEGEKKQVTGERDQASKELKDLRKENAEIKKLHPILEFYGPRAVLTASYDLQKQAGAQIDIGICPNPLCLQMVLLGILEIDGEQKATITVGGNFGHSYSPPGGLLIRIPLRKGCRFTIRIPGYDAVFVLEEDRVTDLRVGVGVKAGAFSEPGAMHLVGEECPDN